MEWIEKALRVNGGSARHHEALGTALMEEGMKASMIRRPFIIGRVSKEFETAVSLDSTLVDAHRGLVTFYSLLPAAMGGGMSTAKKHAAAIMKLNPMRGHMAFGAIAERINDNVTAEKEFRAAISAHPDSSASYISAGAFYHRQKRVDDAIAMYRLAVSTDPKNEVSKKQLTLLTGLKK